MHAAIRTRPHGIPARVLLLAAVLATATAAGIATAPDRDGLPKWVPGTPPTSEGWPVGGFGCDSDPWGQYYYPEAARRGGEIDPKSPPAVRGRPYCLEVPHCGLDWITDFDGSFWEVVEWEPSDTNLLINEGLGSIRLVRPDEAEFTTWIPGGTRGRLGTAVVDVEWHRGARVTLHRLDGPITPAPCF